MNRRRRPSTGRRMVVQAVTVWFLWWVLTRHLHTPDGAAWLIAGAAWGLLIGWRLRGRAHRFLRRLINRFVWRLGIRITFIGRGRR